MKKLLVTTLCLVILVSCRTLKTSTVEYSPKPESVKNPILIIKRIIEQQPPAFTHMPDYVEVDEQCIKLAMTWSIPGPTPIPSASAGIEYICYKNIGKIRLSYNGYDEVWIVKIDDLTGKYMYWIYAYDRHDAEQFIDAISNYVQKK